MILGPSANLVLLDILFSLPVLDATHSKQTLSVHFHDSAQKFAKTLEFPFCLPVHDILLIHQSLSSLKTYLIIHIHQAPGAAKSEPASSTHYFSAGLQKTTVVGKEVVMGASLQLGNVCLTKWF